MNIVILGIGKIGRTLTEYLVHEEHDITIIDSNAEIIDSVVDEYDVMGIVGNCVTLTVEKNNSIANADVVIATTPSDEINMLCCLMAKKVGVKHTVARIRDPEYSRQLSFVLSSLGIDLIVNPELETAKEISRMIRFPKAVKVDTFAQGRVDLTEIIIPENSPIDGIKVMDITKTLDVNLLVCAVQRGEEVYIPNGHFLLQAGDRIHFTAPHKKINSFFKAIKAEAQKMKTVFIIGGGKTSYYLADKLSDYGYRVRIMERDEKRCLELSETLKDCEIIHGDGINTDVLEEENFNSTDVSVSLTNIDEQNIIISLFAKEQGIPKIITKVNNEGLVPMLSGIGFETVISPKKVVPGMILSYIRGLSGTEGSSVKMLHKIVEDRVEALEFSVNESSKFCGHALRELKLKGNILISCIIRKNEIIIPHGNDEIHVGDNVIVVTTIENLKSLDDILA